MSTKWKWGVGVSLVLSIVLLITLRELFSHDDGRAWVAAIQSVATLALIAVTSVYVWLTATLVEATRHHNREGLLLNAAAELTSLTMEVRLLSLRARRKFTFEPSDPVPSSDQVDEVVESLLSEQRRLINLVPLLPKALRAPTLELGLLLNDCTGRLNGLNGAIARASVGKDDPQWADVKEAFPKTPEASEYEWRDILSGERLEELLTGSSNLMVQASDYLTTVS